MFFLLHRRRHPRPPSALPRAIHARKAEAARAASPSFPPEACLRGRGQGGGGRKPKGGSLRYMGGEQAGDFVRVWPETSAGETEREDSLRLYHDILRGGGATRRKIRVRSMSWPCLNGVTRHDPCCWSRAGLKGLTQ